ARIAMIAAAAQTFVRSAPLFFCTEMSAMPDLDSLCVKDRVLPALDELDERHLGTVALPMYDLQQARIATGAFRDLGSDRIEEREEHIIVLDLTRRKSPGMKVATLRERDEPLREGTKLLGLRRGRLNPAVAEKARRHVPKKRFAMARGAAELPPFL